MVESFGGGMVLPCGTRDADELRVGFSTCSAELTKATVLPYGSNVRGYGT